MSIRNALLIVVIVFGVVATAFVGIISVLSLGKNVTREAQERVNHDLNVVQSQFEDQLALLARRIGEDAIEFSIYMDDVEYFLEEIKQRYRLTILNVCDSDGKPIVGSYPDQTNSIPIGMDPILRRALGGSLTWGTMLLDSNRLQLEGGAALKNSSLVHKAESQSEPATTSVDQVDQLFSSRNISLDVDVPEQIHVNVDPELMRIATMNFLSNAAKYGRGDGRANLRVELKDGQVVLIVWNEGEGFTSEEGKQLFKKFSRLKNPNTKDKRGSGLGL